MDALERLAWAGGVTALTAAASIDKDTKTAAAVSTKNRTPGGLAGRPHAIAETAEGRHPTIYSQSAGQTAAWTTAPELKPSFVNVSGAQVSIPPDYVAWRAGTSNRDESRVHLWI